MKSLPRKPLHPCLQEYPWCTGKLDSHARQRRALLAHHSARNSNMPTRVRVDFPGDRLREFRWATGSHRGRNVELMKMKKRPGMSAH